MSIVLVGSTSGSITLQEPAVAGTTVLDLPAVSGTILTTTSPKAGNVIQVVNATYSTGVSNNTSTYADTGLTATITPTSTTNKILVLFNQNGCGKENGNLSSRIELRLLKGATEILFIEGVAGFTATDIRNYCGSISSSYLDSPATISATTYKTQFRNETNASGVFVNAGNSTSTITLMEIAA